MGIQELMQAIAPYLKSKEGQLWVLLLGAAIVIVFLTLVWQSASSVQLAFSGGQTNAANPETNYVVSQPAVKNIADHPLFGQGEMAGKVNTHYQLFGVLYTKDPKQRKAIIGSSSQAPEIYNANQSLKEGGKLYQVNADHILLMRNGQIEKVYLNWEGGGVAAPKRAQPAAASEDDNTPEIPLGTGMMGFGVPSAGNGSDNQAQAEAWRERIKAMREKYAMPPAPNNPGRSPNPAVNTPVLPKLPAGALHGGN